MQAKALSNIHHRVPEIPNNLTVRYEDFWVYMDENTNMTPFLFIGFAHAQSHEYYIRHSDAAQRTPINSIAIKLLRLENSDIEFEHRSKLVPSYRYAGATVIKDSDGFMAAYAASCTPEQIVETPASAGAIIHEVVGDLLYQARNNARHALWESRGNLAFQCSVVYQLLGRLRRQLPQQAAQQVQPPG